MNVILINIARAGTRGSLNVVLPQIAVPFYYYYYFFYFMYELNYAYYAFGERIRSSRSWKDLLSFSLQRDDTFTRLILLVRGKQKGTV